MTACWEARKLVRVEQTSFWGRVAENTKPSGALTSMENPMTIVWMVLAWTVGSIPSSFVIIGVLFRFDEPQAGWLFTAYAVGAVLALLVFVRTGSVRGTFLFLFLSGLFTAASVHVSMGGYANAGANMMSGIALTIVAVLLWKRWEAVAAGAFIAALVVVFGFVDRSLQASRPPPDPTLPIILFTFFIVTLLILVMPVIGLLVNRLSLERKRAEDLLLNVLPREVASELKETGETTTRRFESVSVLFADIVGFTPLTADMEPERMVDQLNAVFTEFDAISARFGCEKIRTIGDAYMVACGVPTERDDHAQAIANVALEMLKHSRTGHLRFRIGVNSGPVIAGVVGASKFQYDIWGDTVNLASRMESHGEQDKIQITEATYRLIAEDFETSPRGMIHVKGKGELHKWYLRGRRGDPPPASE
jgi:guanylate cyclase